MGGVTKGEKKFIRFLAVIGHSESILNFCKNDGGGRGSKIVYPEFTEIILHAFTEETLA